jgi:hypothetical protein
VTRARLAEILVCVIERLLADRRSLADVDEWVGSLEDRGVAPGETRQVIGWLVATLGRGTAAGESPERTGSRRGVHVLDRNDQAGLTLGAQGLLIELRELGLLDDIQVEEVVERALFRGTGPMGREELGMVVAEVLMDAATENAGGYPYWDLLRGDEGVMH